MNKDQWKRDSNGKVIKDSAYFAAVGRKGGLETKKRLKTDPDYYSRTGLLGGKTMLATYGKEFYSKLGKMSGPGRKKETQ